VSEDSKKQCFVLSGDEVPHRESSCNTLQSKATEELALYWASRTRQGFLTPPADGLDLIHDFFADEWINLRRIYDPAKGSYRAYAYRAFVQFVRPRIVRMQRLPELQRPA
jgi:hypothetical protein